MIAAALAGLLAACGGEDDSEESGCAASGAPTAKGQVTLLAAETKEEGAVIADAACQPLYVNDVETDKKVSCTDECASVWIPFTLPAKGSVRALTPEQIGQVLLVERPDGKTQVSLNGQPLYRFSGDGEAGDTNGEGVSDSFGGVDYEWSVLTLEEAAPQEGPPPKTPSN